MSDLDGDIFPIDDFVEACKDGAFIDYDGFGEYCDKYVDDDVLAGEDLSGVYCDGF